MPTKSSRSPSPSPSSVKAKTLYPTTPQKKATIPTAFREQIWLREFGKVYEAKCPIPWCQNTITVYDFESGHNIPESKGGKTVPDNLIPICSRCNKSMGNRYTIDEWKGLGAVPVPLPGQSSQVPLAPPPRTFCC